MKNILILIFISIVLAVDAQVPSNDEISGAIPLCYNTSISGTSLLSTKGIDESAYCISTAPTSSGVWYSFKGNGKNIELNTCLGSDYDTRIFLYTGTSGFLTCVTQNDDACANKSRIIFPSVLNEEYLLLVSGYSSETGNFGLEIITDIDSLEVQACDSYISPSGNNYTVSTTFFDTLQSVNACDSITYFELNIYNTFQTTVSQVNASSCSGLNDDTLYAVSNNPLVVNHLWYDAPTGGNLISQGDTFVPNVSRSTNFYVSPDASTPAEMPSPTNGVATGNTFGYWFTAPSSFIITKLSVPNNFTTGLQSIAVVKFDNNQAPPTLGLSTNDFSTLYLTQGNPATGIIEVNIAVGQGEVIGILGSRGSNSSLSNALDYTIINGDTVFLSELRQPGNLITTAPYNLSDANFTGFVGGIDFSYISTDICIAQTRTPFFLEVYDNYLDSIIIQTCDSYISPIGDLYTGSSTFYDTLISVNGCDSVIFVDLTLEYTSTDSLNVIACDTFISPSGKIFTSSSVFTDTLYTSIGCYQFKYIDLTVGSSSLDSINEIACDSYISPNGTTRTQSAMFYDTLSSALGCDSVVFVDLTVNYSNLSTINRVVCDSFISAQGNVFDTSAVFYDTLVTSLGCDSVLYTTLTVYNSTLENLMPIVCDSYTSPSGTVYTSSITFYDTLTSINGCDSIFYIDLTVNNAQVNNLNVSSCNSYISPLGNTYTSSALINDTLTTYLGCDSIVNINLTINYNTLDSIYPEVCANYTSPLGTIYTSTSLFDESFTTSNGCDSIVRIFLTVHQEDTIFISPVVCGSYTSPAGNVYTSSSTFTEVLTSSFGCDSIYHISLTIPPVSSGSISPVVCNEYVSPLGFTFTDSQNFTETLIAANGCDSILSINLTVNKTKYDTLEVSTCGQYVSPNGTQYVTSGYYTESFTASSGCDSIYVIHLSFNPLDLGIDKLHDVLSSLEYGASYQWFDCNTNQEISGATSRQFTAPENGSYRVIIENGSCTDTSVCVNVNSITALSNLSLATLKVHPNPFNNKFYISIEDITESQVYEVYNISGKLILEGNINDTKNEIDMSGFESGVYFLRLGNKTIRLLKMDS